MQNNIQVQKYQDERFEYYPNLQVQSDIEHPLSQQKTHQSKVQSYCQLTRLGSLIGHRTLMQDNGGKLYSHFLMEFVCDNRSSILSVPLMHCH